jgi:hypothetical protein
MVVFVSDITITKPLAMNATLVSHNGLSVSLMAIANYVNFGSKVVPLPQPELEHQPDHPKLVEGKTLNCVCSVFRFISAKSSMPDKAGKAPARVLAVGSWKLAAIDVKMFAGL